jgi:enterochelin esterase family protein
VYVTSAQGTVRAVATRRVTVDGRGVRVWTSDRLRGRRRAPLLVVHDGPEYASRAGLVRLLGRLDRERALPPLRAALLEPHDRMETFSASAAYARSLARSTVPALEEAAPASVRVGLGASLGAFALLHAHVREPRVFDALFLQSGSYFQRRTDPQEADFGRYGRMTRFVSGVLHGRAAGTPLLVTLTCGRDEENLANNRNMAAALAASGYDVCFRSVPGGHDWPTWRRGLETNLVELFAHL